MWNIAKSAEAMFSRWAVKRVCKFVLKKKLGQFILGDIDVDQLDVQFADGTIQLSDLALNVDFLNQKIGAAASVMIKEGSIGSLLVRMPWKGNGCEVELNELELVLAPCTETNSIAAGGNQYKDGGNRGKLNAEMLDGAVKSTKDVHEGVKTIAKMVKWLLTSFNVRIKKLIVVFDPYIEVDGKMSGPPLKTLVLRISEVECGTGVSEDVNQNADVRTENFLGNSQLTSFVKFQGAVLELLQMDDIDDEICNPSVAETTFGEFISRGRPPGVTTPIMTGKNGGFSGNFKLSVPWKNGSLDIGKVDADAQIEPVQLRFQPSTIKWLLLAWEVCTRVKRDQTNYMPTDSIFLDTASHFDSVHSACSTPDKLTPVCGIKPVESTFTLQESVAEGLLPGSRVISDWVPYYINNNRSDGIEELDFGASVDQFFECFDDLRSSQSALGSSGMWNWTCSVVSAITAVSSLASGSLNVTPEQQPVETNLKATLAGICVVFPFQDENPNDTKGRLHSSSDVQYLSIESQDVHVAMQVANYSSHKNSSLKMGLQGCNKVRSQTSSVQRLQADGQRVLPFHASSIYSPELNGFAA